jgi:hypothetical protein
VPAYAGCAREVDSTVVALKSRFEDCPVRVGTRDVAKVELVWPAGTSAAATATAPSVSAESGLTRRISAVSSAQNLEAGETRVRVGGAFV